MEEAGRRLVIPTFRQIVEFNHVVIQATQGFRPVAENLINPNSLYWVLDTIQHPVLFGWDPYPSLFDKAALIAWEIIVGHVFYDGNKRTGMLSAITLLLLNGQAFMADDIQVHDVALNIVNHRTSGYSKTVLSAWFESRSVTIDP